MATKVTNEMIEQINELYLELGIKAQVAKKVGVSPATVSKYIIPNYISVKDRIISSSTEEPTEEISEVFLLDKGRMGEMCVLTQEEREDLIELQKEVMI